MKTLSNSPDAGKLAQATDKPARLTARELALTARELALLTCRGLVALSATGIFAGCRGHHSLEDSDAVATARAALKAYDTEIDGAEKGGVS